MDLYHIKRKGFFKQQLIIKNPSKMNFKLYIDNKEEPLSTSDTIVKPLPAHYQYIKLYKVDLEKEEEIYKIKQKKGRQLLDDLYDKLGFTRFEKLIRLMKKGFYFAWYRHHFLIPPKTLIRYMKSFHQIAKLNNGTTSNLYEDKKAYANWLKTHQEQVTYETLSYQPLISVVIPVYNVSKQLLDECIQSILNQSYQNFEICLADDHSTNEETIHALKSYETNPKIKIEYRKENGMISKATNTAIGIAHGEYIMLVDNDDTIDKDAMYYMVKALNQNEEYDLLYSDEDRIDFSNDRCKPHFKPNYSIDTLMSLNYISHLTMIRKSIIDQLGGFRSEYDGSQDYDLILRVTEMTNRICHIPKILYHWRETSTSTASYLGNKDYTKDASLHALQDALKRRNIKGEVIKNPYCSAYLIRYEHTNPLVSILIPMRDYVDLTKKCIDSIYEKTNYKNFEIIIIDNNSIKQESLNFFEEYKKKYKNIRVIKIDSEFNYSYINNEAVKQASGEYILLLNNDTEVIDSMWLDHMVGYASLKHVGAVGIKLLYPNNKVQHAGVVLGYGGFAGHVFVSYDKDDKGPINRLAMAYNYSAVTAACLLVSKSKYNEVNGLDENLKISQNDVDFNLKLLDKGYYNVLLPYVTMYHYESRSRGYESSNEQHQRLLNEQNYCKEKWKNKFDHDEYFNINLI